jgi:hypothetical protein
MHLAGRGDDAVHFADLAKEPLDTRRVGAVDVILPTRCAHFDHFMARFQFRAHRLAQCAGGADHDDLFHLLLR